MEQTPVYDIRTSENAMKTLVELTGVSPYVWKEYSFRERDYPCTEDLIEEVIQKHGNLDAHDIKIDIENRTLCYKAQIYDISYSECPSDERSEAYACWGIGYRFYGDFTTCGFLSTDVKFAYGGNVHFRPEILVDIDELLGTKLSDEWRISHKPYEVVAAIKGMDIRYDSERGKNLYYLTRAYENAFELLSQEIILLKNGVQIPPDRIIDIRPLHCWKDNQNIFQRHPL